MEMSTETAKIESMIKDSGIYLDYNATTPVDPEVYRAMEPYFKQFFGNPASASHHWGWAAESAVNKAREQVSTLIGAKPNEITFTGGATESNNWVIFGLISKIREENPSEPIHILSSCIEHSSILKALTAARKQNVEVDFLPVNRFGQVEIETIRQAIKPHTKLMSFIWVNNEIGSINPVADIAKLAREHKIYFHTDATQALGKVDVNATAMGIDMMSFSGHKMYGPKGVGGLFIRSKDPKVQINPLIYGGGQEKGLRSGTLNVPAIVGLGAAADLCHRNIKTEVAHMISLRDLLWTELQKALPGITLNGHPTERSPINLNVTLPKTKTEQILPRLQKLGVSTGSACGTGAMVISHVLIGLGLDSETIQRSLRLSLGRWTTEEEIHRAVEILKTAVASAQ
ncbi:Cysteine desulfurase [compost metagenome]